MKPILPRLRRVTWRGFGVFLLIFYTHSVTQHQCGMLVGTSYLMCVFFLLFVRPLILGPNRRYFESETKRTDISDRLPSGWEVNQDVEHDDLP